MTEEQPQSQLSKGAIEAFNDILRAMRCHLRMDVAFVTEFLVGERHFHAWDACIPLRGLGGGARLTDEAGYCAYVRDGRLPQLITDTSLDPFASTLPQTRSVPIGSHLSVPIHLSDGTVFGTFCCFSFDRSPHLNEDSLHLMKTFSALIANRIELEMGRIRQDRAIIERLRSAISDGDPAIVFQPILRLTDLSVVGVEALSRFRSSPRRPPDAWFKDAAEVGLDHTLEFLACRKAIDAGHLLPASMSINLNISPAMLVRGGVLDAIGGMDPRRIVIEITEHAPIVDYDPVVRAVEELRSTGLRIAVDDAGAGYSSLRHVLALKPDIIKLDVSLTRDIHIDPMKEAMAAALVAFSLRTGCKVVAEGIENKEELQKLRHLGIHKGQGYYLGLPQEVHALVESLGSAQAFEQAS